MNNTVYIIAVIIMALAGNLLLALWGYKDAKAKGLKPKFCILLFVLALLNTIGVVIYAIFRNSFEQKGNEVACRQCRARISNDVKFCPNCGVAHSPLEVSPHRKPKKYLLVAGIALITIVFAFAVKEIASLGYFGSSRSLITTFSSGTKWGNTWKMSFRTANGIGEHRFKAESEHCGLIYSSDITKGVIKIDFCDDADNVITEILPNTADTLKNVENGKTYKIVVTADKARGSFSFKMRDF